MSISWLPVVLSLIFIPSFSIQKSKVVLQEYVDLLRSMVDNPIFSEEEREVVSVGLGDSEELLGGEETEMLDLACESQLDLLRGICDPYIARHRKTMEAKVRLQCN